MSSDYIRNFCIIAHIDHGKSTLADRFLELTGTIEKRKMREQFLDMHPLEREKGITIKMQPVRMLWHSHRRTTQNETPNNAEDFLYGELTYKIRGLLFLVRKKIGLGHKEQVYHNALEIEFASAGLRFESKKNIPIWYENKNIGIYQPDFVVEDKVLIELKALPEVGKPQIEQLWSYLKGCDYKLALLVNFGSKDLEIKRVVYDKARLKNSILRSSASGQRESAQVEDIVLNLIDTPGHVDFAYEVSRALAAVEGAILLVDATQGIQAQTVANFNLAREAGLTLIPAMNKIDVSSADQEKTREEIRELFGNNGIAVERVSAKEGTGVERLLERVVREVPSPVPGQERPARALIFDSLFDPYQGIIAFVRMVDGAIERGDALFFIATGAKCAALDVGFFLPERAPQKMIQAGEIGYIATGIKEAGRVRVGDTVTKFSIFNSQFSKHTVSPLEGYREPQPLVYASLFPVDQDDYDLLRDSLWKLKLNDAALTFEPEAADSALGRGFRCGFLGVLHMEIVSERMKREYNLELIFSHPSVAYRVLKKGQRGGTSGAGQRLEVYSAAHMPAFHEIESIEEPWARAEIITPARFLGVLTTLVSSKGGAICDSHTLAGGRLRLICEVPFREIITDFYDFLKSVSQGFASLSYEFLDYRAGNLVRLDLLVAGDRIASFAEIVPRDDAERIARIRLEKLKSLLSHEQFAVALQGEVDGRIIARETISALKKDVTGYLYGGDRTRKMKLWQKQKRGKKRLKTAGNVHIPTEVFLKMVRR